MAGRIKLIRALICALFPFVCLQGISGGLRPSAAASGEFSLSKPLSLKWKFETAETLGLTPAVSRDIVYLPLSGGRIISLGIADGSLNWKAELGGDVSAEPDADESGVYVATETPALPRSPFLQATGALRALSRLSGVGLWMRTLPAPIRGSLVSNDTTLFGAAADGRVYALKKKTGEVVWVKQFTTSFISAPVLHGGNLFVCDSEGVIIGLEQATGNTSWRYRTRQKIRSPPSVNETFVYAGTADGNVFAFETVTARLRWRERPGGAVAAVRLAGRVR